MVQDRRCHRTPGRIWNRVGGDKWQKNQYLSRGSQRSGIGMSNEEKISFIPALYHIFLYTSGWDAIVVCIKHQTNVSQSSKGWRREKLQTRKRIAPALFFLIYIAWMIAGDSEGALSGLKVIFDWNSIFAKEIVWPCYSLTRWSSIFSQPAPPWT